MRERGRGLGSIAPREIIAAAAMAGAEAMFLETESHNVRV